MPLLDYFYVDLPKVASLHSQLVPAGSRDATPDGAKPSHAALAAFERDLAAQGYLLDLTPDGTRRSLRDPAQRQNLAATLCVRVTGRIVIEDYERIRRAMDTLPEAVAFVNKSVQTSVRSTDDFRQLEMTVVAEAEQLREDTDRTSRAASQARLQQMKSDLDEALRAAITATEVDQWMLDGLKSWIDTYLPGVINLRVHPLADSVDEHVFGRLKREHFFEHGLDALHDAGGATPTAMITLVGVVSAVPVEGPDAFNPLVEFDREGLTNAQTLEKSHRDVLQNMDALAQLARACRYPRVMVQPLMVYRRFDANPRATVG